MAFRPSSKIIRFLELNRCLKIVKSFSRQSPKSKCVIPEQKQAEQNLKINKPISITIRNDIEVNKISQKLEEKQLLPSISSHILEQDSDLKLCRKFAKSNTQNAITMPLKIPRLANPFPEPVKTLQSDTVSDEEKAKQMQEQVKMEARFHLQSQQEMLLQQKLHKMSQQQHVELNTNKINQQSDLSTCQKPKYDVDFQKEEENIILTLDTTEKNAEDCKEEKPRSRKCRKKSHTRAAKYLRHSWYPRHIKRQMREYSTNSSTLHPVLLTEMEQCEQIIERLKSLHPEYQNLKKPISMPGSKEEKEFIKNIFKLIAKHKHDLSKKQPAPFPSYSEVKTFVHEPKIVDLSKSVSRNDFKKQMNLSVGNSRFYSTKNSEKTKEQKICPSFKMKDCKAVRKGSYYESEKQSIAEKQEAPYPSYSECMDNPVEEELSERKICPWKGDFNLFNRNPNKKRFSTNVSGDSNLQTQICKKRKPCKNPYDNTPVCDYEETARKNAEKKKRHKNSSKPKKKASGESENGKVIRKIKNWLSSYRPESNNIRISRSEVDIDGRETYIIEVSEVEETPQHVPIPNIKEMDKQSEDCSSHVVELSEPCPVVTKNIPGFFTSPDDKCKSKKKKQQKKKKCRQVKKKKLPSCDDLRKKKTMPAVIPELEDKPQFSPTKTYFKSPQNVDKPNINIKSNDFPPFIHKTLSRKEFVPFKLKSEFWKKHD